MISSSFCYVSFVKEKKKCVYRLNVFAIALVLFVPRFLFIFFFSLSFRSRSDIYFSITVYEDRLYHGLSVLARFTFCASECFSPSLSLSLSHNGFISSARDTQSNFDATATGKIESMFAF